MTTLIVFLIDHPLEVFTSMTHWSVQVYYQLVVQSAVQLAECS